MTSFWEFLRVSVYFYMLCGILGDTSVLKLLLDMKMNPIETNEDNEIFLHVAAEHNQAEILKQFSSKIMCRLTVCHITRFLSLPVSIRFYGFVLTCVHYFPLLSKFVTWLWIWQDNRGFTPLHTACEAGHNESILALLPLSDLGQINQQKQTALHLAVRSKTVNEETILFLVDHMIQDYDWTTLHMKVDCLSYIAVVTIFSSSFLLLSSETSNLLEW